MPFSSSVRRQPAPFLSRNDERPTALTEERKTPGQQRAIPEAKVELFKTDGDLARVSDQTDLRDPEQLGGVEGPGLACLSEGTMRDQFDDVARRIVEIERMGVPVVEVEDNLIDVAAEKKIGSVTRPDQGRGEAITGGKECVMVKRLSFSAPKDQFRDSDSEAASGPLHAELVCVEVLKVS
ncbi:MAG: hypothetical protein WKF41_09285 [Gaiellaceae bacterium]